MLSDTTTLFETLQKEFCPALDSSLIAVLLAEIEVDGNGNTISPPRAQINNLRATLRELSIQADEYEQSELSDLQLASQFEETISSWTTPDAYDTEKTSGDSSTSSGSSQHSFSSPIGFLQAALPDVSTAKLRQALERFEGDEMDMWDIVATILTEESIREMEERGLEGLEDQDDLDSVIPDNIQWEIVESKKKPPPKGPKRKTKPRAKKYVLADVRQQHQARSQYTHKKSMSDTTGMHSPPGPAADPWTQISSLSSQVSTLLPPHPPSTFMSFFHCPEYETSYDALRGALSSLCKPSREDKHTTVLFNLLDVVVPEYEDQDVEERTRLISDVELAIAVTDGEGDSALDLVHLLRELDSNSDMGLYHLRPQPSTSQSQQSISTRAQGTLPSHPPPISPPPKEKQRPQSPSGNKPSPYQWQVVPQRKPLPPRGPHPLVHHIPAYAKDVNGFKSYRGALKSGAKPQDPATYEMRRRMGESIKKKNHLLMEASRMWQQGNSKKRGGEIAFYFAERAREFQALAKQEALNAARVMVESKRTTVGNHDIIDLHGTTVNEAIVITKEILNSPSSAVSQAKPMKIITGRGSHSIGQVSVLKPAVRNALQQDGWVVASWDGGLVVRGRRAGV